MKKLTRTQWLVIALGLLSLAITAYFYPKLPDQIPTSWGFDGSVRYDGKQNIWAFGIMGAVFGPMFVLLPQVDPRKKNYAKFSRGYDSFCIFMQLFLLVMQGVILSESFRPGRIAVSTLVISLTGLLFVVMGNILPKSKSNFFFGMKTPWTLSDPEVWNRTNRLAGKLFFFGGLLILPLPWLLEERLLFWVFMAILMVITIWPTVCSYRWYQQRQRQNPSSEEE